MNIKTKKVWDDAKDVTSESVYYQRRKFLKALGFGSIAAGLGFTGAWWRVEGRRNQILKQELKKLNDYQRNNKFSVLSSEVTDRVWPMSYNNFYEFSYEKDRVAEEAKEFHLDPYRLVIDGLVEHQKSFGLEELERRELEERIYRFRCVEAWSMVIPWIGFPLWKLIQECRPLSKAKYVAFTSFYDPNQAPNQREGGEHDFPYYEALKLEEAMNELTLVTLGSYGRVLSPQSGAPCRIVIPWKYGFKGPKSVVRITLTEKQPATFWNDAFPQEYSFEANVNPEVPHPRWSQARERVLGKWGRKPTLKYNGYGEYVRHLYS